MSKPGRREFLKAMGSGALAAASLPLSIRRALAIPAHNEKRSIEDVEHIVILMQENRSFDHYFGTMKGVRGFGDPRAVDWRGQLRSVRLRPEWVFPCI
jgi:phospholipase C